MRGAKPRHIDVEEFDRVVRDIGDKKISVRKAAEYFKLSKPTFISYVRKYLSPEICGEIQDGFFKPGQRKHFAKPRKKDGSLHADDLPILY